MSAASVITKQRTLARVMVKTFFFAVAAWTVLPCGFSHEMSDAFSLNTYFLSTTTFSLFPENLEQGIYNFTFPLRSAAPVMPLLHPSKSGMQHAFLDTLRFLTDLAFLGVTTAGKGFIQTGTAALAQTVDPAARHPAWRDKVMSAGKGGRQAPTSVLLGVSGSDAMAVFDMLDLVISSGDAVVMTLRLVEEPHLLSEFETHPKQQIRHDDEHYHFFPSGGFSLDARKLLHVTDSGCEAESCTQGSRQAVLFLKGNVCEGRPEWQYVPCTAGTVCTQFPGTSCDGIQIAGGRGCYCLYPNGFDVASNGPCLLDANGNRVTGAGLSVVCSEGQMDVNGVCSGPVGTLCVIDTYDGGDGGGGGDPHLVGFDGTQYEVGVSPDSKGNVYSIISAHNFAFNSYFDRAPGPNRWPFWGTWMRAFGFKHALGMELEIALRPDLQFPEIKDSSNPHQNRSVLPGGGFEEVLDIQVNGKSALVYIESGETVNIGNGMNLHFPDANQKHSRDATDGPVLVVTTPEIQVIVYLETEEVTHLDFSVQILGGVSDMHGLLGQTYRWRDSSVPKAVEGEEWYYIVDSLTATEFEYSLYGRNQGKGRAVISLGYEAGGIAGGSTAAVQEHSKYQVQ